MKEAQSNVLVRSRWANISIRPKHPSSMTTCGPCRIFLLHILPPSVSLRALIVLVILARKSAPWGFCATAKITLLSLLLTQTKTWWDTHWARQPLTKKTWLTKDGKEMKLPLPLWQNRGIDKKALKKENMGSCASHICRLPSHPSR